MPYFQRVLIANRGEIAVRVIRACRELGLETVAVYSEADSNARHVQMADRAVLIGPPPPRESYLRAEAILEAARQTQAQAIHPGYGFLSEREAFAQAVLDAGLVWIGPPPRAIELMGVKTAARALMQEAGVPIVPGYQDDAAELDDLLHAAEKIGLPLMVKAAGGGGGKGIRIVRHLNDLAEALRSAQNEARSAFNDPRLFLERYVERGRHIEVQVLADAHGNTVHLFERECSAQRRHQKIIEETPSPLLTPELRQQMGRAAVAAARAVGYVNAGTVEFIATEQGEFFFLEMNTRLQVEHPITELVTGLDLVKLQLRIAQGEPLPFQQDDLRQQGHAIEARLYAEDPRNGFLPSIGKLERFIPPTGPGLRVDSGVQSGDSITIHYDPMIAKLIVYDRTREAAIERLRQALRETVILGTTTNIDFLQALLAHPLFIEGRVHTAFIDAHLDELMPPTLPVPPLALLIAALDEAQQRLGESAAGAAADSDLHSPWGQTDGWRIT
ncbi:MAG: acetyl-CoA carboxylase biotin carboxylase subunit [Anaerolineae bacterium]|nr:acetyl-CoA carboxylase biotin carboxylase subunit [Anaerolineae bacterium]MDW8173747.1 acetyl-CoA carboxylase biotin carboxylase subunit [Anaerolineae bacterium]